MLVFDGELIKNNSEYLGHHVLDVNIEDKEETIKQLMKFFYIMSWL